MAYGERSRGHVESRRIRQEIFVVWLSDATKKNAKFGGGGGGGESVVVQQRPLSQ